jgi:uncharacterized iron-regulated membrane protein
MSFQEKFAWLSLAAMFVSYGAYFVITANGPPAQAGTLEGLSQVWLFGACSAAHALIVGVGQFLLGKRQKLDERDHAIERRSTQAAFWFLLVSMMLVGVVLPLTGTSGWEVANPALFAIILSLGVQSAVQIWLYRRGSA